MFSVSVNVILEHWNITELIIIINSMVYLNSVYLYYCYGLISITRIINNNNRANKMNNNNNNLIRINLFYYITVKLSNPLDFEKNFHNECLGLLSVWWEILNKEDNFNYLVKHIEWIYCKNH